MTKIGRENFDESLAIHQIRQTFPPPKFCAIRYIQCSYVATKNFTTYVTN